MIQLKNISKKYDHTTIFQQINFTFPDQGFFTILGPSGCGKTTLLNLIAGFDCDYKGDLIVHNQNLSQMNQDALCSYRKDNLGFIFQNYHLLTGYTALENIQLASSLTKSQTSEEDTIKLLKQLGLEDKIHQKIETLSGGQKQRVAIARALINNPSILLADEPTGALDRKNADEIMLLLKELSKTRLVIMITHDKKCAQYSDHILTIKNKTLQCEEILPEYKQELSFITKEPVKQNLWKQAIKNFKLHFTRYMTIALAISIGVLCFTCSLSSKNMMQHSIQEFQENNTAYHNGFIKLNENEDLFNQLNNDPKINNVYLQYKLENIQIQTNDKEITIPEKYPLAKATQQLSYGTMPHNDTNEIAISPSLAAKYDQNIQNLIGKTVTFTYNHQSYDLIISGIFNAQYDDFMISSTIEQKLYESIDTKPYSISYDVIEFNEIVSVNDTLQKQNIHTENASKEVAAFLATFTNIQRLFFIISFLIFMIGFMISTILLIKQQNTRYHETGLLSALGYTRKNIKTILFNENILLCFLSGFCNLLLTTILRLTMQSTILLTLPQILLSFGITIVLILILAYYSSIRLIRCEPSLALRK